MTARFISAIDIGTNSFHLLVARISGEEFEVVHREREVLRLRENSKTIGHIISNNKTNDAIEVLKKFKIVSDKFHAEIIAIATSAMRDALNKDEVCRIISETVGIKVKILSGEEEASLVFKAALYKKEISCKKTLIFDLGGGSTELIIGQNGKVIYKKSLQLGAVRFAQKHFPDFILTPAGIENLIEEVKAVISKVKKEIIQIGFDDCIGIGGTITSISWLIEKNIYGREHNYALLSDYKVNKRDFHKVRDIVLGKKTFEERLLINGMEQKRADIIPAGILIIEQLFDELRIEEVIASGFSIKEGIVIDAIQQTN